MVIRSDETISGSEVIESSWIRNWGIKRRVTKDLMTYSCSWSVEARLLRGERNPRDHTDSFCQTTREILTQAMSEGQKRRDRWNELALAAWKIKQQIPKPEISLHTLVKHDVWPMSPGPGLRSPGFLVPLWGHPVFTVVNTSMVLGRGLGEAT